MTSDDVAQQSPARKTRLSLAHKLKWVLTVLVLVGVVAFATFFKIDDIVQLPASVRGTSDRNLHFAGFCLLSLLTIMRERGKLNYLGLLVLLAALIEVVQIYIPGREGNIGDFIASSLGVLSGFLGAVFVDWLRPIRRV